jgi:ABC-type dipeptide/oligopeptide/nickel transport system permease subunit
LIKKNIPSLSPKGTVGLILTGLLLSLALIGPLLAPHDPIQTNLFQRLQAPSWTYPLGTDALGRCLLSRVIWGARVSLGTGILILGLALSVGVFMGMMSVLSGKWLDGPVKGLMDITLAFPGMILALMMIGIFGPSLYSLIIGLAAAGWAWWARFIRALVLTALTREFILGGRMVGVRGFRLIVHYLFPQIWPQLLIAASLRTGWTILLVAGLGFLGLGSQQPTPEWGTMLQESRLYLVRAPWLMLAPGGAITLTILALTLLSEGLRDRLQPGSKGRY